ncbi:MAG: LPS sulfotransferase NodH [Parasphingorhabdus sp.]
MPELFLVVTLGRTGSNYLLSLLHSHPEITTYGEPLGEYELGKKDNLHKIRKLGALDFVHNFIGEDAKTRFTGIKVMYHHFDPQYHESYEINGLNEFAEFISKNKKLKIIHLTRRNYLRTLVSKQLTRKTNQYHITDVHFRTNNISVTLEKAFCENAFIWYLEKENEFRCLFRNHASLDLVYEDLNSCFASECGRVLSFLGLADLPLNSQLQKQNVRPLSEIIRNYKQLRVDFSETKWSTFFDD